MSGLTNWDKYVLIHAKETKGACALLEYGICTCDDGIAGKAIDVVYAKEIEKFRPKPKPVEQLPVEVVDKFAPFDSLYELTLTTTKDDVYELRQWFNKIVRSAMYMVKGYIACIELQKNGNPHIHALLFSTNKHCDSSKIKKSLKFPYLYTMKKVRKPANYYAYINKEADNPIVKDYCVSRGVDQIWEELF